MKAARLYKHGSPESIVCEDAPQPSPGPGELLVRVHAAGVTPSELSWYPTSTQSNGQPRSMPIILGHEFSGVVAAVGPEVSDFSIGDAVFGMNDWFCDGAQAEYCIARASDIAFKPDQVDHAAAAVTPISALTAWQGLVERASLGANQRVLIHGAAGAVGSFAVQLAKHYGAHIIATVSAQNTDYVRSMGAHEIIDYTITRFEDAVGEIDVVFDTVGGDTLQRSWTVLKPSGTLVTIAANRTGNEDARTKEAFFIVVPNTPQLTEIARLIDSKVLNPVVDSVLPLSKASYAHQHKPLRGKVALEIVNS